jgi:hypothetical protein
VEAARKSKRKNTRNPNAETSKAEIEAKQAV